MSRLRLLVKGALITPVLALGAARLRRRAEGRGRSDHAHVAVLDLIQQIHRRRGQGPGRRSLAAVQLRVRHRQADHRREERDRARRQGHHLFAVRQFGGGHGAEDRGGGEACGRRRRRRARHRPGRDRRARQQRRLWREGLQIHRRTRAGRPGRADHGRPGFDQRTRSRQRLPRLHQEELSEAEAARNPDQGLVGRRRGGRARHDPQFDPQSEGDLHARRRRLPRADAADPEAREPVASGRRSGPHHHRQQRRHPAGIRGHPQGRNRRDRLAAGRPLRQVRHHVPEAAIEGKTFQPGPTDHDSTIVEVAGRASRTSSPPRWSPRRTSTTRRSGAT